MHFERVVETSRSFTSVFCNCDKMHVYSNEYTCVLYNDFFCAYVDDNKMCDDR